MIAVESVPMLHSAAGLAILSSVAQALPDTIVTVQAGAHGIQRVISIVQSVASLVIALALIAIAIPLIPAAWNSRKTYKKVNEMIERFRGDLDPIVKHGVALADNLDYISTSVRVDVQQLNQTIAAANQRLNRAAILAEERVNEFNGLLQVVQEEAENLFIGTASAIRGVQMGTEAFQRYQTDEIYDEDDELLDNELLDADDRA